ncbi:MAG: sigma-70 family RNA polymerase sigma factor [Solirubrobacteraceae bacterium]
MSGGRRDEAEFRAFVERFSPTLLRAAFLLLRDRGAAEDAVQTALERTYRRWSAARRAPEPYSRQVLVNVCRNHWRTRARHPEEPVGASLPALDPVVSEGLAVDERLTLDGLLAELSPSQRAVLVLRFYLDLSVAETATLLQIAEGTVKSTTHRAIDRLRNSLDEHPQEVSSHADR